MARTRTLAELRTSVARRGGYENSRDIDAALLTEFVNEALAELWDTLLKKGDDRYLCRATKLYAAGRDGASLPDDCYRVRKVEIQDGENWLVVPTHDLDSAHVYKNTGSADPSCFRRRLQGNKIVLVPTPTSAQTLHVYYEPFCPTLVNDDDTMDASNGYEELVIQLALLRCYKRQDQPTEETAAEVARLMRRVEAASTGRDGPFYLDPHGPDADNWGDP